MPAKKIKAKTDDQPQKLEVPEMKKAVMKITISGNSIITHAWSEKAKKQIQATQAEKDKDLTSGRGKKKKRPPRDPQAEYEAARYLNDKGKDCIPAVGIKNAIVTAGMRFLGQKQPTLRGVINVRGSGAGNHDLVPLKFKKRVMRTDSVNIGWPKVADLRYRPEYKDWSVDLDVEFDEEFITPESLLNLIRRAGFSVGIFEWRAEKGGQFGSFDVSEQVQVRRLRRAA